MTTDTAPWVRIGIRCSALMTVTIVGAIGASWSSPGRRTFNFENVINALGTFALAVACVNCLLAIVIFWKVPGTHSVWLNTALLTPVFVLLLFPAVALS
jgi:hypothetical protein